MLKDDSFQPLPGEQQLFTSPARTSIAVTSTNKQPGQQQFAVQGSAGRAFLTNRRLIYIPTKPTPTFQSFAAPILNFHDAHVTAPWFGANQWIAAVQPVTGGGISAQYPLLEVKLTFNEGGAFDFHGYFERIKERLQQVVSVAQDAGYERGANTLDTTAVHLEELPSYESHTTSRTVEEPALIDLAETTIATEGIHRPGPRRPSPSQPGFVAPDEPPPAYDEVQLNSIAQDLERSLREDVR